MKNIYLLKSALITMLIILVSGCDSLNEDVLDESLTNTGDASVVSGFVAPAYGALRNTWQHKKNFGLQEISSDEAILPYRGGSDWYDGGQFIATHQHLMTPGTSLVKNTWDAVTQNISRSVTAIETLRSLSKKGDTEATDALYEMIALRAYLNMMALDNWGLSFQKESTDILSVILRKQKAIDYIEKDLLSVVDKINTDKGPGRFTQGAVWAMLARLYLNAAVYRDPYGTPDFKKEDMEKVITYTDKIINSGKYALSPEYFDIFNDDNHVNKELIFALDHRGVLKSETVTWLYWSMPQSLIARPDNITSRGTDGPAMTTDFYQTWVDANAPKDPAVDARFYKKNENIPATNLTAFENFDKTKLITQDKKTYIDSTNFYTIKAADFQIDRGILRGYIWGPRKTVKGDIMMKDGKVKIYPVVQDHGKSDPDEGHYINLTPQVDFTTKGSYHHTGYRYSKYQYSKTLVGPNDYTSVDLVLMRLGEVYLMRAEAKLRNGDNNGALADINTLRASRNARPNQTPVALTSIDLDVLFRESGFELYWEGLRRIYQIRFGKWENSWTEKTDKDVNKRLFPIPQSAIDGSSILKGFLEQNKGY